MAAASVSVTGRDLMHYARVILCAGVGGLLLGVGGCTTQWIIPVCQEDAKTPCVGQCTIPVDSQALTMRTVPLAVVIRDHGGTLHCQEIQP
jgi:hypothetical protein